MQHCPHCGHDQSPADRCGSCGEWLGGAGVVTPTQTADSAPVAVIDVTMPPGYDPAEPTIPGFDDVPLPPPAPPAPPPPPPAPAPVWQTPPAIETEPEPVPVPMPAPGAEFPADHPFADQQPPAAAVAEPDHPFVAQGPRDDAVDLGGHAAPVGLSGRAIAVATGRRQRIPGAVYALFTTMLIGVIAVVILTQVNDGSSSRKPADPAGAKANTPDESLVRQRDAVEQRWAELSRLERTDQSAALLDQGTRQIGSLHANWERGDWSSASADLIGLTSTLDAMEKVRKEVEEVARQRKLADDLRQAVATARSAAERTGAPTLAAKLWADANAADEAAKAKFDAAKFPEARADWDQALTAFEQANSLAAAGVAAAQVRKRIADRSTERFTVDQLDAMGGPDWKDVTELMARGDKAYTDADYSESMANFEHAGDRIEAAEVAVQREVGVKFYAVKAGYLAASILLEHASGLYLDEAGRDTLAGAFRDLRLPDSFVSSLPAPADDKLAYRKLADVLVTSARSAITEARGQSAQQAYNIGFQLRIVQKLLGEEGEEISDANRVEIGKSLVVMERDAKEAGFPDPLIKLCEEVRQLLSGKPTLSAAGGARTRWTELVGKLSRYDTAIGIVGPIQK